jgi:hypothetical protein
VLAYAFLAEGAVEPLSGFVWPTAREDEQSDWVAADAASHEALRGYRPGDLPYWLDDELWSIELDGRLEERPHVLIAERARLRNRIDTWSDVLAREFAGACAQRVAERAAAALRAAGRAEAAASLEEAEDLEGLEGAASAAADDGAGTLAGYTADVCFYARDAGVPARGACVAAKMSAYALAGDVDDVNERAWQAAWLAERLGLETAPGLPGRAPSDASGSTVAN